MSVPAIVAAGDLRAAKAIHGDSKAYLEIGGRALVVHAVTTLQDVPEVSEVWVVGNAERLGRVLGTDEVRAALRKPLHIVPQFRSLYENGWEAFRRLLPGAGPEGRDPGPEDADTAVLFLSADIPFAAPEEISAFVRGALETRCDYALGLVTEESMRDFHPTPSGEPGIRMACFNLREGRFRQSNLHLLRPARIGNRHYIEEMYEHRHQREFGQILGLAWRLLRSERGGLGVLTYYLLMHLAGFLDRQGFVALADALRRWIPAARIERGVSSLLRAPFRLIVTEAGGSAVDIDTEEDFEIAKVRFESWWKAQRERAARIYGTTALSGHTAGPSDPER
jgi:GTP:adenosylcobinamide-phosphate guanylyltransferase